MRVGGLTDLMFPYLTSTTGLDILDILDIFDILDIVLMCSGAIYIVTRNENLCSMYIGGSMYIGAVCLQTRF